MKVTPVSRVGNEDADPAQSVKAIETEIVLYAHITNMAGFEEATRKEEHHQLEVRFETGHTSRVRKVTKDGEDTYSFTFKVKGDAPEGGQLVSAMIENTVGVDKDFFDNFMKVAKRELVKTRYVFSSKDVTLSMAQPDADPVNVSIPNIEYEVDVYQKADGEISSWCKIDVEVDNVLNFIAKEYSDLKNINVKLKISHLPFGPAAVIKSNTQDADEKTQISAIWDEFARPLNEADPTIPA